MRRSRAPQNVRRVTYRRYGIPAIIIEGKWLIRRYHMLPGDEVTIDYGRRQLVVQLPPRRRLIFKERH
jgi:signal peptidase I